MTDKFPVHIKKYEVGKFVLCFPQFIKKRRLYQPEIFRFIVILVRSTLQWLGEMIQINRSRQPWGKQKKVRLEQKKGQPHAVAPFLFDI